MISKYKEVKVDIGEEYLRLLYNHIKYFPTLKHYRLYVLSGLIQLQDFH
jgi:hypothetical protein